MVNYIIIGIILIIFCILGIRIVRPIHVGIVERFGKYNRTITAGFNWIIPFVERDITVTITEQTVDVPKQHVITKDNVSLAVDGIVYIKVLDPKNSLYSVMHYKTALISLSQTTLRSIIGTMKLDECLNNRELINAKILSQLDKECKNWSVDILRMEIQSLDPPASILNAMESEMKAERMKRSIIISSEATLLESQNLANAEIEKSRGIAESLKITASAESKAIEVIDEKLQKSKNYIEYKKIDKWDGVVPKVTSTNGGIIVDLKNN